jgi:hypothetical protein
MKSWNFGQKQNTAFIEGTGKDRKCIQNFKPDRGFKI